MRRNRRAKGDAMPTSNNDEIDWRMVFHELRQPIAHVRIVAQDVRLDIARGRFDIATLPESMRGVEKAVDAMMAQLDHLENLLTE